MVFFTCNACGESLKKNQVEKHYRQRCRRCEVLTCVDCHKDFPGDSYQSHTKCISENEKYSAKGWQPKASANKGERKQQNWIQNLQVVIADNSAAMSPDVRRVLNAVMDHENIPRKKAKFANFVKNVVRGVRPTTIDDTWELFEQALKKPNEGEVEEAKAEEQRQNPSKVENGGASEDRENNKEEEERLGVPRFKGAKLECISNGASDDKKPKKKKSKDKKKVPKEEVGENEAGQSDICKENDERTRKKRKRQAVEDNRQNHFDQPSYKKKKKTKEENTGVVEEEDSQVGIETKKFVWDDVIESVLKEEGDGVKVKRLKKKVLAEYMARFGDTHRTREELSAKLDRKINKSHRFKVLKEVVSLKNA